MEFYQKRITFLMNVRLKRNFGSWKFFFGVLASLSATVPLRKWLSVLQPFSLEIFYSAQNFASDGTQRDHVWGKIILTLRSPIIEAIMDFDRNRKLPGIISKWHKDVLKWFKQGASNNGQKNFHYFFHFFFSINARKIHCTHEHW